MEGLHTWVLGTQKSLLAVMGAQNQGIIKQSSRVWTEHCHCSEPQCQVTSFLFLCSLSLLPAGVVRCQATACLSITSLPCVLLCRCLLIVLAWILAADHFFSRFKAHVLETVGPHFVTTGQWVAPSTLVPAPQIPGLWHLCTVPGQPA